MTKKMASFSLLSLFLLITLLTGCGGGSGTTSPIPPFLTSVIDISHDSPTPHGFGFGDGPGTDQEVKRWQTFIATSYPVVTAVEVKICKYGTGESFTTVRVELY